jgi:NADPH-dependent 2,4-dienoyl-CoA reductase/sulfur reductase-like enzyme
VRKEGVKVVHEAAASIDRDKREVVLAGGKRIPYDRLVVAPGIDIKFDSVPGYSEAAAQVMPHAWKPGPQTELLVKKLNALKDGDTIVMIAPPNPYRCPPGPYERVSMFAHVLKQKGHKKSKIIVLDPKANFSKQALFLEGWEKHYPGMIEWQDPKMHGGIKSVDAKTGEIKTDLADYKAALANVIPAQMAGRIARDAGLADQSGFCPIDPENMKSKMDANIFVVGDACIPGDMPKSAFSANSQAKVAAMHVAGDLVKARTFPARYTNTCWSLIETDDDVKVGGSYEPGDGKIKAVTTFVSQKGEPAELRKQNYKESVDWYTSIIGDVFG